MKNSRHGLRVKLIRVLSFISNFLHTFSDLILLPFQKKIQEQDSILLSIYIPVIPLSLKSKTTALPLSL
jgi:hypothetical protein